MHNIQEHASLMMFSKIVRNQSETSLCLETKGTAIYTFPGNAPERVAWVVVEIGNRGERLVALRDGCRWVQLQRTLVADISYINDRHTYDYAKFQVKQMMRGHTSLQVHRRPWLQQRARMSPAAGPERAHFLRNG